MGSNWDHSGVTAAKSFRFGVGVGGQHIADIAVIARDRKSQGAGDRRNRRDRSVIAVIGKAAVPEGGN